MYEYKYSGCTMKVDMLPCCEWIPRYAKICRSTKAMITRSIRANYSRRFPATRLFCCNKNTERCECSREIMSDVQI